MASPTEMVANRWRAAEPHVSAQTESVFNYGAEPGHALTKPSSGVWLQPVLFDFAESFHDFRHRVILPAGQLINEF